MMTNRVSLFGVFGAAALGAAGAAMAEPSLQLGIGAQYSSGDYDRGSDTEILDVPFTVRLRNGNWSFRARIPYSSIEGPGGVVPGEDDSGRQRRRRRGSEESGGDTPDDDPTAIDDPALDFDPVNESGLGDISLSTSYEFNIGRSTYLDVSGKVTLPTGDQEKDLGIGETDYQVLTELGRSLSSGGVYASGGYKFRGGTGREDGLIGSVGAYGLIGTTITGVELNWREAAVLDADDALSTSAYTSFRLTPDVRLSLFAEAGLSDNTPDIGAGVGLTWRTNFRRPMQGR